MALTPDDEEIASQYRKMLKMGLPEGAVMQKMAIGDVPQNIQDAVLSGDDTLPNNTNGGGHVGDEENKTDNPIRDGSDGSGSDPPTNTDAMSEREYLEEEEEEEIEVDYEEEIIEDDDLMEEEVIDDESDDDDDDDDDEFEEEILEEIVEEDVEIQYAPNYQIAPDNQTRQTEEDITESTHTRKMNNNAPIQQQPRREQVEYQQQLRREQVEYQQEQLRRQQPPPNKILVKREPEKPLPSPSACWYWILCIILLGLIGAAAGGGYWLTTRDGDNVSTIQPPNRTTPPTAAPSVGVSTSFNDVQGGECNFDDVSNPNPIDQCICFGEIAIIETDIRERYRYNLESFVETYYENYDDDISSCSPRNQALVWISSGDDAELTTTQRIQRFALATIFASLGGTQWNNSENWLIYDDSCTWFGVACSEGVATELVLDGNNLVGMLPSEVSLLEKLQFLMVARNKIDGPIPVSLFSLEMIGTVDVGFNSMTGVIPPTVGDALYLNSLNVENNFMSGRLTKRIGEAKNLGYLNLKSNQFLSELPMELFSLKQMIELNIGDNQFIGTISQDISKLNGLSRLTLGPNLFTGTIPSTISSLSRLSYLSARGIKGLSGRIPAEFGFKLTNLQEIIISDTGIEGSIDTSFGMLPNLETLEFSRNQLRSTIPSELGNLRNLVTLNLEQNFLDGTIPEAVGNILTLQQIRLNNNLLEGGIPISISNLSSLETMQLEANRLEDRVEDKICDLRKDRLDVFVVDCPIEIESETGVEIFGVVCEIPECCTKCVLQ